MRDCFGKKFGDSLSKLKFYKIFWINFILDYKTLETDLTQCCYFAKFKLSALLFHPRFRHPCECPSLKRTSAKLKEEEAALSPGSIVLSNNAVVVI